MHVTVSAPHRFIATLQMLMQGVVKVQHVALVPGLCVLINMSRMQHCAQVATRLLTPICPHTCEHMWRDVLGHKDSSVLTAGFPKLQDGEAHDFTLQYAGICLWAHAEFLLGTGQFSLTSRRRGFAS